MKRLLLIAVLLLSLVPLPTLAQQAGDIQQTAGRIAGSVLIGGSSMAYTTILTEQFGPRLTSSAAYKNSAEWAALQFRAMGIKNVKTETFTIPHGWERGRTRATMLAPFNRPLAIESLGWTPSTPPQGIKADVFPLSDITPENIKQESGRIKDRVVMLDTKKIFANGYAEVFGLFMASFKRLKEAGARAVLLPDGTANNVLNAFNPLWGADLTELPVAQIGSEDAQFIQRYWDRFEQRNRANPITIEFQYENKITGPTEIINVIAEIPGREQPDEWVLVGAHLDSWDYGTGAQDNATGCAMVLDAARAIAAGGNRPPRRSIRFALWGGEEQGLLGSTAYVRAHAAELNKCVAVLNTDNGAGHPRGWKVQGREDVARTLKPLSDSLLVNLGGDGISQETTFDTDHGPFMLEGVPALDLWVDMTNYGKVHHKSSDTIDKVDAHNLAAGAAIVAVTAYAVADNLRPLGPKLDRPAVGEILKKAKLENFLKEIGMWK